MCRSISLLAIVACLLQGCLHQPMQSSAHQQAMVATADYRATQAGIHTLKRGGSAVDAAIAIQSVLSLVEPQSSGLGGGAFMLYYNASDQSLYAFDGRELSPSALKPNTFLDANGQPKGYFDTAFGGQTVGVPGVVAMLDQAHQQFGRLDWSSLFGNAKQLAINGFEVSSRLSQWLNRFPHDQAHPQMLRYFYDESGVARPAGYPLTNPAYAKTLDTLAANGAQSFYTGKIAQAISDAVNTSPVHSGSLSPDDLANYRALSRQPLCKHYHQYKVCSIGPPSSGGVFLLQTLKLLEPFNLSQYAPFSPQALHLIIEASRLSFADRQQFIGDPDVVDVPTSGLLNDLYLQDRAQLINPNQKANQVYAGQPEHFDPSFHHAINQSPHIGKEYPSTSHFSVMDRAGNVVSMTTTVQGPFGSFLPAGGFILNNQLTDFSYVAKKDGKPIANAIAPNKRPRSSMTPTIVFDEHDQVLLVIGSPGGGRIFSYVLKALLATLDWGMTLQSAIDAPNITIPNGSIEFEAYRFDPKTLAALNKLGHTTKQSRQTSGLNGFMIQGRQVIGGVDKRREGTFKKITK